LVLTHPEAWSRAEVLTLINAAELAGVPFERVVTVSEPRAAVQHYSQTEHLVAGDKIAVFDFGGGTLDIAVLVATETDEFAVRAAGGDNQLGGRNLDALVRRWVDARLNEENPDLLEFLRRGAPMDILRALDDSIRHAKELLSETAQATITVIDPRDDSRHSLTLARAEFEELIAEQIERAATLTGVVLGWAGCTARAHLRALFPIGGSSRIPLVQSKISSFGSIVTLGDPKTVVVRGALVPMGPPVTAAPVQGAGSTPGPIGATDPGPHRPAVPATGRRRPRRGVLLGAGVALAAALIAVGVMAVPAFSDDTDGPSPTNSATAKRTAADDETAIRDFIPRYLAVAGPGVNTPAARPMQCSTLSRPTEGETVPADRRFTLNNIVSIDVNGDTASARIAVSTTSGGKTTGPNTVVFNLAYEDGAWRFCGADN
jgi:hypothetical protein